MSKKNALLVMAATYDYLFAVGNVLLGLKKHSPQMFDDIIIYTDDLASDKDKKALKQIFANIQFKIYDFQLDNEADRQRLKYYSNMPYARFEMLSYLDRYKKVFWFDSDFLILGDVSGLLEYAQTGISMSLDLEPYPKNHSISPFFLQDIKGYDMSAKAYASGLIIFSDALKEPLKLRAYLYQKMNEYSSLVTWAEQGILQLMIEDFKLKVQTFPKLIYHAFPFEDKSKAKLIHLLGDSKPWLYYLGEAYDVWYEQHEEWLGLGGSEAQSFEKLLGLDHKEFNSAAEMMQVCKLQKYFFGKKRYQSLLLMKTLQEMSTQSTEFHTQNIHSEVQKVKNQLSYQLGQALVKNPLLFPFRAFGIYKNFKKKKSKF